MLANIMFMFIRKFCDQSGSAEITSAVERWGKWGKVKQCPDNTLLYSASLRSEKPLKLWADDVSGMDGYLSI